MTFPFYGSGQIPAPASSPTALSSVADPDPDLWIQICIIKVGSGSVWRDTNPDPNPGHIR